MKRYIFGVDIGGTTTKLGAFTEDGKLLSKWKIPTRISDGGNKILIDIKESIGQKMTDNGWKQEDIIGVGIGVPGPVGEDGVVHKCVNLGWDILDVPKIFEEMTGFPTKVGNDANVAALGEMWQGGGKGYKNVVMATLGTGVGGGIIINGKIVTGANGAAGEIGHLPMRDDEKEACGCGKHGCLEQYASANGLVRLTEKYLSQSPHCETALKKYDVITAETICNEVKNGDDIANLMLNLSMNILGKGFAMIACVVNPEVFVIGGGLAQAGDIVIECIEKAYRKYAFHAAQDTEFKLAKLGNDAGIYGAAKLVLE